MSDASQPGTPSISFDSEIELICVRFEETWKAGQRPSIEKHLSEMPVDGRHPLLIELLKLDIYYRRRMVEEPTPEEYAARFPGYAELLRGVFTEAYVGEQGAIDDGAVASTVIAGPCENPGHTLNATAPVQCPGTGSLARIT